MACNNSAHLQLILVILIINSIISQTVADDPYSDVVKMFETNETNSFNNLIVDKNTGVVFIGATNRLYELTPDLEMVKSIVTGPKNDSYECYIDSCPPDIVPSFIDNVNKVLLIDYANDTLISCGSVSQGSCYVMKVNNISDSKHFPIHVAANDASSYTVAFIGPGPSETPVLYVGASSTNSTHDLIPAVCSRSIRKDTFEIAFNEAGKETRVFVKSTPEKPYMINYVYGFSSRLFSYFLTVQMAYKRESRHLISKLVRVCHDDSNYDSYTEVPFNCSGKNGIVYDLVQAAYVGKVDSLLAEKLEITTQDDVLFVVFNQNRDNLSNIPSDRSSLCIYSLKLIEQIFLKNIERCYKGHGSKGLYIAQNMKCHSTEYVIDVDFCQSDANKYIDGEIPVNVDAAFEFNEEITSIVATPIGLHTVVFAGTSRGHIKKILVNEWLNATEYDDIVIQEGFAVHRDLHFDSDSKFLYVMTDNGISKLRLQKCSTHTTCITCMESKDPFCGWCSLENKCSLYSECQNAFEQDLNWIPYTAPHCPAIIEVKPKMIQISSVEYLKIRLENLPSFSGDFTCTFSIPELTLTTEAARTADVVECSTPNINGASFIPDGQHNNTIQLAIQVNNGPDVAKTWFTYYDCGSYGSCIECTSLFPCDWCIFENRCTNDSSAQFCKSDTTMSVVKMKNLLEGEDSLSSCPIITGISGTSDQMLIVPCGVKKSVQVNVDSISLISNLTFHCHFDDGSKLITAKAELLGEVISCGAEEFSYTEEIPNMMMDFSVTWNSYKNIDNKHKVNVMVFKCKYMADSCGLCLSIETKYGCGWCQTSNSCEIYEQCDGGDGGDDGDEVNNWLNYSNICPHPEIHSFHPLTGLFDVDNIFMIEGVNLGQSLSNFTSSVQVAGEECQSLEDFLSNSNKIKCKVDRLQEPREGPIVVQIGNYSCQSKLNFSFVNPVIKSLSPTFGPRSGKTVLNITGKYLNAGNNVQVFINKKSCAILFSSEEEIVCRCMDSSGAMIGNLTMDFDGGLRECDTSFQFVDDPEIVACSDSTGKLAPKGIVSGGVDIQVSGRNLNSVAAPSIVVYFDGSIFSGNCIVSSNMSMICESPRISIDQTSVANDPLYLDYGFGMDGIESLRNLSGKGSFKKFCLYPDPTYMKFNDDIKYLKSEYLTIDGKNLTLASGNTEVMIGKGICNITSLSKNQLTCRPPAEEIIADDEEDAFDVTVKFGRNIKFYIGRLSYRGPGTTYMIVCVCVGIISTLMILFLLFFFIYKKKSTESIKNLKNMKAQMDKLELRVAAECKESFAELQTEMIDLRGDLSDGIPFLDYRTYTMNVLFPNIDNSHKLYWGMSESTDQDKGLFLFQQLITNKLFLLNLIDTLESNKYFSLSDRVSTASYLMIILQNEMEYCTDILKNLLAKLIEKSVKGHCHPKILLRRTDSVAEKMLSSWFTFLLHNFLKDCAGEPLYKLFRSVKAQLDKGPVDVITSEAKYSLGEGKLLRESVDFKCMSVNVSFPLSMRNAIKTESEAEHISVKVLDCDTISQVKDKCIDTLYKAKPYSRWPIKEDFDLAWKTGFQTRVLLHDEDKTNQLEDGWKKLNTLKHYKVPNGADLVLVCKHDSIDKFSTIKSLNYDTLKRSELKSEKSVKIWHLVKQHDDGAYIESERGNKMVSEIYLTRLLATKGTLQKFVNDLFETVFNSSNISVFPFAIKYMFDFLDEQAALHNISDPEVVHMWKNNSLPLRFWVNLIKNPNFIFDIHKSNSVDGCLSVIAQTFMDSCSVAEHILDKDSPSSKLLYAKDIPVYKTWVKQYYESIKNMAAISDQDLSALLAEESRNHTNEFNINYALKELYSYVHKYSEQLRVTLEEDETSQKQRLAQKLNQLHSLMQGSVTFSL